MVPGAFGAYPVRRETPYWENPAPRMSKGKIYSQSKGKYIHKIEVGVKNKMDKIYCKTMVIVSSAVMTVIFIFNSTVFFSVCL